VRRDGAHLPGRTFPQAAAGHSEHSAAQAGIPAPGADVARFHPPGNRLEALKGGRAGQHSIRINDQWRICFVWRGANAEQVEIVDYH